MKVYTEAYPHDWQGEVICSACGTEHQADHASVRLILDDGRHWRIVADDLCDDCIANAPELAANTLKREADVWREHADAMVEQAEELRQEADELAQLAEEQGQRAAEIDAKAQDPEGTWATPADLAAAVQEAKGYLATLPPPPPSGWEERYDGEEIPF